MDSTDPESSLSGRADSARSGHGLPSTPTVTEPLPATMTRILAIAAIAGLLSGAASLIAGEMILKSYQNELVPALKAHPSAEDLRRWREARIHSAALTIMATGGILGLTMGIAGGVARRSSNASAGAAIVGLVLGFAVAASLGLFLVSNFFKKFDPQSGDLVLPLLTHGAIWSAVGAIGGLAFGLGLGGKGRWTATLGGGLLGAAAAAVIYEIVGALAFASSKTDQPVSATLASRGMAHFLVAILSATGAALALRQSPKKPASSSDLS